MRLYHHINEVFDTKVRLKEIPSPRGKIYEFKINKKKYEVIFDFFQKKTRAYMTFNMKYHPKHGNVYDTGIAKTGDEFKVFSGVIQAFNEFLKDNKPDQIIFEADTDEPSRIKLYDKFSKVISKRFPYRMKRRVEQRHTIGYTFWRKDYDGGT